MVSPKAGIRPYLRSLAGWAWNRQNDAKAHGLSLQEETLTEMLLLRIAKDCKPLGLRVKMFTRHEEKRNGADWEWFVRGRQCSIGYRVQAKRLYHAGPFRGQYGGHDPKGSQTARLIRNAGKKNVPIYMFYNHSSTTVFHGLRSSGFRGPSYWGCSYASASSVKAANSRKPTDLIKHMHPWHELFDHCISAQKKAAKPSATGNTSRPDSQAITPSDPQPDGDPVWLQLLENAPDMEGYLRENELAGVAYIDASNADLDWSSE